MLAIYSEANVLENLNKDGVFPDIFATDIDKFRNILIGVGTEATVVVILSNGGVSDRFKAMELIDSLRKRQKDGYLKQAFILSNNTIKQLDDYYMYDLSLSRLEKYNGLKSTGIVQKYLLASLSTASENGTVELSEYDRGSAEFARATYYVVSQEKEDYKDLIRKPKSKQTA